MIKNKNLSDLYRGILKACDVATSLDDVSMIAVINDIVEHVETIQRLTMLGGSTTITLTNDGAVCINDGAGWPVEGKSLQRCLHEQFLYAHGTTLFDIRCLRKELGFKKEEYADDYSPDCSAKERIVLALIAAANERGVTLTEAINSLNKNELEQHLEVFLS